MPYQTPQTLQSTRYLQVTQTAPPLRNPQLQPSNSERLASTRHRTTVLKQVLLAEESEAADEYLDSIAEAPRTPTRTYKKSASREASSEAVQQRLFGQVRKSGNAQDPREATAKASVSEQARQTGDTEIERE
jgi:hypothetical protein